MTDLPAPLTPADCDLRDFPFLPMDIVRLFGSRFHAIASDSEWRAGVTLWLKSFHQVPAGSIPDDDIELCRLAELGRDLKEWKRLRDGALYGWVKCSDGRLYHPVVCQKASEAWSRKQWQRERSKKANNARWKSKSDASDDQNGHHDDTEKHLGSNTAPIQDVSLKDASSIQQASLNDPKGEGEREGQGEGRESGSLRSPVAREDRAQRKKLAALWFGRFWQLYPRKDAKGYAEEAFEKALKIATPEEIIAGVERYQFSDARQFIPLPATWLNSKRWLSETMPPSQPPPDFWDVALERMPLVRPQFDLEMTTDEHGSFHIPA